MPPNLLLQKILPSLPPASHCLDLGCGRGRDTLALLQNGHHVTGVDRSAKSLFVIKEQAQQSKKHLKRRLKLVQKSIETFEIPAKKYNCIIAFNSLSFLSRTDGIHVIESMKQGLSAGGYLIISAFTQTDPFYQERPDGFFLHKNELRNIFSDFKIHFYQERAFLDPGHPGTPDPHEHSTVEMIAQRNPIHEEKA